MFARLVSHLHFLGVEIFGGVAFVVISIVCFSFYHYSTSITPDLYVVAWLASVGWVVTNTISLRNTRTTHTFNMLVELRTNALFHRHRSNLFSKLGYTSVLTPEQLQSLIQERDACKDWEKDIPALESIIFLGNLYENVAYGVRRRDLDRKVVQMTIRNLIVGFFDDYAVFIQYCHDEDARTFEHLIWLAKKFDAKSLTAKRQAKRVEI
jgi:hypothetical protein